MYYKNFDLWNEKKKRVESELHSKTRYFNEREIWWCSVGVNVGVEVDGKNNDFERPVLVIKKFNKMMFWGIPLTSKEIYRSYLIKVSHEKGFSFANLAQLRLFSSKRIRRKITMLSVKSFQEVLTKLVDCISKNGPLL
jgi:mRNA interferase MazF